jgi:SNF family Na+-dependent transporter
MQYLGKGSGNILSIVWFGTLFLLGIDSMFAIVEGISTIITDTPRFAHIAKESVALWMCILGFLCSVAFVTDIGYYLVDTFDHYLLNYGLIAVGAMEAYTVAWVRPAS